MPHPRLLIIPAIITCCALLAILSIKVNSGLAQQVNPSNSGIASEHSNQSQSLNSDFPANIQKWKEMIEASASETGLDPNLIAAVMLQESGGDARAFSVSGAVGLMQIMPKDGIAAKFLCGDHPCFINRPTSDELYDPFFNIRYGSNYLADLIELKGSEREALYAYGPIDMGYYYADLVLAIYEDYQ